MDRCIQVKAMEPGTLRIEWSDAYFHEVRDLPSEELDAIAGNIAELRRLFGGTQDWLANNAPYVRVIIDDALQSDERLAFLRPIATSAVADADAAPVEIDIVRHTTAMRGMSDDD